MDEFEDVYATHQERLMRLAGVLCRDHALAEDVVAEAFARTYPKWKRGKVDDPGAYLRRCVVNLLASNWRHRSRASRLAPPLDEPAADAGLADRHLVRAALGELPVKQRAIVALRFLEGHSEAETAAILDVPLGTVKSASSRALDRLRSLLAEERDRA